MRLPPHTHDPSSMPWTTQASFEFWVRSSWDRDLPIFCIQNAALDVQMNLLVQNITAAQTFPHIESSILTANVNPDILKLTEIKDQWKYIAITFDLVGSNVETVVYLDGINVQTLNSATNGATSLFEDNSLIHLGGRLKTNYFTADTTANTDCRYVYLYSVSIFDTVRTFESIRSQIEVTCLQEASWEECHTCPVMLGLCLPDGCETCSGVNNLYQYKTLGDVCTESAGDCKTSNTMTCSTCNELDTYVDTEGTCQSCKSGCKACRSKDQCYDCKKGLNENDQYGGVNPMRCEGFYSFSKTVDLPQTLDLPFDSDDAFVDGWNVQFWYYRSADMGSDTHGKDNAIMDLGNYVIYTEESATAGSYDIKVEQKDVSDTVLTNAASPSEPGKWTYIAFKMQENSRLGTLIIWNDSYSANYLTSDLAVSNFTFLPPTQLRLCPNRCRGYFKGIELWKKFRIDDQIKASEFLLPTLSPDISALYYLSSPTFELENAADPTLVFTLDPIIDSYWIEQEAQYFKKKEQGNLDPDVMSPEDFFLPVTKGFPQCQTKRNYSVYMLCPESMHWKFNTRCPTQDIVDDQSGVKIRLGYTREYERLYDPYYLSDVRTEIGLSFTGTQFLQLPPFYRQTGVNTHLTNQVEEEETSIITWLYDWSLEMWLYPQTKNAETQAIWSITRPDGTPQFQFLIDRPEGSDLTYFRLRMFNTQGQVKEIASDSVTLGEGPEPIQTDQWRFYQLTVRIDNIHANALQFTYFLARSGGTSISSTATQTLFSSTVNYLTETPSWTYDDFQVSSNAKMLFGTAFEYNKLDKFYSGRIFEIFMSNYYKTSDNVADTYILDTQNISDLQLENDAFGLNGDSCTCIYPCTECLPSDLNACTSCESPFNLLCSNTAVDLSAELCTDGGTCLIACPAGYVASNTNCLVVENPMISSATFLPNYRGIQVDFDQRVAVIFNDSFCDLFFENVTAKKLGYYAYCTLNSDSKSMTALFGDDPQLLPDDTIYLAFETFYSTALPSAPLIENEVVVTQAVTQENTDVQLSLVGPNMHSKSQDLIIRTDNSKGKLLRRLLYKWEFVSQESKHLERWMSDYSDYILDEHTLTIPADLLPENKYLEIRATAKNYIDNTGTSTIKIFISTREITQVMFTNGNNAKVRRYRAAIFPILLKPLRDVSMADLDVTFKLVGFECPEKEKSEAGECPVTELDLQQYWDMPTQSLQIPPYSLESGYHYTIAAELTNANDPITNSRAVITFEVEHSNLYVSILGGDRSVSAKTGSVELSGENSVDLDYPGEPLSISWICPDCGSDIQISSLDGTRPNGLAGLDDMAKILLNISPGILNQNVEIEVTMTVSINNTKKSLTQSVSTVITWSDLDHPDLILARPTIDTEFKLIPDNINYLNASSNWQLADQSFRPELIWSSTPVDKLYSIMFSPTNSYMNTVAKGSSLKLPLRQYRISVSLLESEVTTNAFMDVETNASPTDGQFTLAKQKEPANMYKASAPNWEDDDGNYPLMYEILDINEITLGTLSWINERNLILLDDSNVATRYKKTIVLRVYDQLETYSQTVYNEEVLPVGYDWVDFRKQTVDNRIMHRNATETDQYLVGSYGSWLYNSTEEYFKTGTLTKNMKDTYLGDLQELFTIVEDLLEAGYQNCFTYRYLARDLELLSKLGTLYLEQDSIRMIDFSTKLLTAALENERLDCLNDDDIRAIFNSYELFSDKFDRFETYMATLTENLKLMGKVLMRPRVVGQEFLLEGKHIYAKYIRFNTESQTGTYEFKFNDLSQVALQASGIKLNATTIGNDDPFRCFDNFMLLLDYNAYANLTYTNHPDLLVNHGLDRKQIIENEDMTSAQFDISFHSSCSIRDNKWIDLSPTYDSQAQVEAELFKNPVNGKNLIADLTFPLYKYNLQTFINSTCEVWQANEWDTQTCDQSNVELRNGLATCICSSENSNMTLTSNILDEANVGDDIVELPIRVQDPFELNEIGDDNNGYMFFMNPIWILIMLWTFHTCCLLMIYVKDRDDPNAQDTQTFIQRTMGQTWQTITEKSWGTLWLDESILLGVYRVAKPWFSRAIRMNIIFTKLYVALVLPGLEYHYSDHSLQPTYGDPNFWIAVFGTVAASAVIHFFFTIMMNSKITSQGVQHSIYIFMVALNMIIFVAIVAIVAVHDEDLYIIWMSAFVIAAIIDFLIMDNIYVLFKLVVLKIGTSTDQDKQV